MRKFFKRLFCHHQWEWDMTRPLIVRHFTLFSPVQYEETLTPIQCPKCGKLGTESDIV